MDSAVSDRSSVYPVQHLSGGHIDLLYSQLLHYVSGALRGQFSAFVLHAHDPQPV
jgi:hypothetical protein